MDKFLITSGFLKAEKVRKTMKSIAYLLAQHYDVGLATDVIKAIILGLDGGPEKFEHDAIYIIKELNTYNTTTVLKREILRQNIQTLIEEADGGWVSYSQLDKELAIIGPKDMNYRRQVIYKLIKEGIIEKHPTQDGLIRKVIQDVDEINWQDADISKITKIRWPFVLENQVNIYPRNLIVIAGSPNAGKGHPDGTPILTPDGWVNIEKLKMGDTVFASDGTVCKLSGIFPRGLQQCFEFIFNDGSSVVTDFEHLWTIQTDYFRKNKTTGRGNVNKKYKTWQTLEAYKLISLFGGIGVNKKRAITIPKNDQLLWPMRDVPISAYLMGILLGDGHLSRGTIGVTTGDQEIIDYLAKNFSVGTVYQNKRNKCSSVSLLKMIKTIEKLGLKGKRSWEKFIPKEYLYNEIGTRLALLRGLMDTDGNISRNGQTINFTTVSSLLADDVAFLVRSLGGKAKIVARYTRYKSKGEYKRGRLSYRIFIVMKNYCPFLLERKAKRYKPTIKRDLKRLVEIKNVGIQATTCISIAHPSGLYITKDFIVTHNTAFLLNFIELNMKHYPIHYFSSEMGPEELKLRISKFDIPMDQWEFKSYERATDFARVIRPDDINIIDYLEIGDNFFTITDEFRKIFDNLGKGIAIVALQKKFGATMGRGAEFGMEKPRLYLTMDSGELIIQKAKNWATKDNPNKIKIRFKLIDGAKFIQTGRENNVPF